MYCRFAVLLLFSARVYGCSCGGIWPSAKHAWQASPGVFLGTVEFADPDGDPRETMFEQQSVRVHVDEAFKGVVKGQTIELHQEGTDCDAKFRTGQRAVFYLGEDEVTGSWFVSPCTRAVSKAAPLGDDLLFLHGLPKSAKGARLSGEVELYDEPVPNIRVKVTGPAGVTRETVTNSDGAYEVYGLRPGKYSVTVEVPRSLRIGFSFTAGSAPIQGEDGAVELSAKGASVSFVLKADTRISGRVLNISGEPIKDGCVRLEPLDGGKKYDGWFAKCSEADGTFEIATAPPGLYRLVMHDKVAVHGMTSESTLYYPGVRDRDHSKIISVIPGDSMESFVMRIPVNNNRYQVTGRLQFADGSLVPDMTVTFTSAQHGYTETAETRQDGSFRLPIVEGMSGQLTGKLFVMDPAVLKSCPQFEIGRSGRGVGLTIDATPIFVSAGSAHEDLTLQLPAKSCISWPYAKKK